MGDGRRARRAAYRGQPDLPQARQGAGGVHHVAFRTPNPEEFNEWVKRTAGFGIRSSGEVERYYFTSLYFREPNGILFEIATDGPGFTADEPLETSASACRCRPSSRGGGRRSRPG
jgi:glyoxalase family protein